ncbi:MAG: hypothetical protein IPK13_26595 [Deltaproteobacteria bacterium]|nr:hypothetical protein [Deltaproteobacteria bacterium]
MEDETLQVRVRNKNPLIERRPSHRQDTDTRAGDGPPTPSPSHLDEASNTLPPPDPEVPTTTPARGGRGVAELGAGHRAGQRADPGPDHGAEHRAEHGTEDIEIDEDETVVTTQNPNLEAAIRTALRGEEAVTKPMLRAHPSAASTPIDHLSSLLMEREMRTLHLILNGGFDQPDMDGASSPKRALEHLVLDRPYQNLSPREQALTLGAIATHPRDIATTKAAIAIMKTGVLEALPTEARSRFLELFLALASVPRALLARLGARRIEEDTSAALATDTENAWIIESLRALAELEAPVDRPRGPGIVGSDFITQTLTHITQPETMPLEDGFGGHVLAIEFALALVDPAEYVRHAVAAARMRRMTPDLSYPHEAIQAPASTPALDRTPASEPPLRRVFLTLAAHHHATMPSETKTQNRDRAADIEAILRLAATVYNRPYVARNGEQLSAVLEPLTRTSAGLRLRAESRPRAPVFIAIEHRRGERLFLVDHIDDTHLFLRAPHGRSSKREGATREAPRREVVDPALGLERIPLVMAKQWAAYVITPAVPPRS